MNRDDGGVVGEDDSEEGQDDDGPCLHLKPCPASFPPLEQLQLRPPPARAHKSFNGCAAQLPLITASAETLFNIQGAFF